MTRDGKILLGVLLVVVAVGGYGYSELRKEVRHAQAMASVCRCPYDTSGQAALAQINLHHRYATASHSYFERLLEGLVRHARLPIERARDDLKKSHGAFMPPDWKWLAPWETGGEKPMIGDPQPATPPDPSPSTPRDPPARPDMQPPGAAAPGMAAPGAAAPGMAAPGMAAPGMAAPLAAPRSQLQP